MSQAKPAPLRLPLLVLASTALLLWLAGGLDRADNGLADLLTRQHAKSRPPPADIVLIAIDQKSLEGMVDVAGAWPWPRSVHAEVLDFLAPYQPRAVAFDIFFNEADTVQGDSDRAFREVVLGQKNLFFASQSMPQGSPTLMDRLPASFGARRIGDPKPGDQAPILMLPGVLDPRSWQGGLIDFETDADGVGRHVRTWTDIAGWRLPGMAANVARYAGATLPDQPRLRLNWYGKPPRTISYIDLFEDLNLAEPKIAPTLEGSVVVIGATASGLNDLRSTPMGSQTLGVLVITTGIANLRTGDWLRELPARWPLALIVSAVMVGLFRRRYSPLRIGFGLAVASLALVATAYLALKLQWYVPAGASLLLAWLGYGLFTVQAQWIEHRDREATIGIFGRFLDPRVVESLVAAGELTREKKPEAREITILFSDIRGFTTLSETRTPEQVVDLLNRYFTRQVDVIFRHGGTLDKFIGDAVMAFWNAPSETPGHAEKAVTAALEMTEALDDFKRELLAGGEGLGDFDVGIGLHTGPAVVGFLGSDTRMEYTAIGDTVNLGSRIESATKGVARVLVSGATKSACGPESRFEFVHRGQFHVKGREQPVDLYEPLLPPPSP